MERIEATPTASGTLAGTLLPGTEVPEAAVRQRSTPTNTVVDMGWGRLHFGHTFESNERLADSLRGELAGRRDIAMYLPEPHVVVSLAPHELFLDPSHTLRLRREKYAGGPRSTLTVRPPRSLDEARRVNTLYTARGMVTVDESWLLERREDDVTIHFLALSQAGQVLGTVTGVDHVRAFDDPEGGASLWCLAVDAQASPPGVGETLVRHLVEHFFRLGRSYVDLSVMHDNTEAIALYEKLGFERVPAFCIKNKNSFNEPLFVAPAPDEAVNPYARIIIDEARRRGIGVEIVTTEPAIFRLRLGGREVTCHESLSEMTTAVALRICDDKQLTHRVLADEGLRQPAQQEATTPTSNRAFLETHGSVVVKPARGEQGAGITVDVRTPEGLRAAVEHARAYCSRVLLEQYVAGTDLRVIVIDHQVVAAAVRRPPRVMGTGRHSISELIDKYNRRRMAATDGESRVPVDDITLDCLKEQGVQLDSVPVSGADVVLRKAANVHTGGTIHDVTAELHPALAAAAVRAATALRIPVVGLDFIVGDPALDDYVLIEANERPGLANHEPQPTAARFVDLLFPAS